jgi:hypothetical protein
MLVVCSNKDLYGFTYGRIYHFISDPDMFCSGYVWVKNDKNLIVGEPKLFFKTLDEWKKILKEKKDFRKEENIRW